MPQYEHKVLYALLPGARPGALVARETKDQLLPASDLEEQLDVLSGEGWEVFASHTGMWGTFFFGSGCQTPVLHVILRRPRPAE